MMAPQYAAGSMAASFDDRSVDHDDKYNKFRKGGPEAIAKYQDVLGSFSLDGVTDKHVYAWFQNAFVAYFIFLFMVLVGYESLGGSLSDTSTSARFRYCAAAAEALGLLSVRRKIQKQGNVKGISGMTMLMYAAVYIWRMFDAPKTMSLESINDWVVFAQSAVALLVLLDVLRSVFVTYRSSYQVDLDVLKAQYLIPVCLLAAMLVRPAFMDSSWFSFSLASVLYIDMTALMPQIVFMMRGDGKVQAPVANFVAATAVSKIADCGYWYMNFNERQFFHEGDIWSPSLMLGAHIVMVLLIADFMYHYLKARFSGASFSDDLDLTEEVCMSV